MSEEARARIETDDDQEAARIDADEGEVAVDGATFRFRFDRPGSNRAGDADGSETDAEPADGNGDGDDSDSDAVGTADESGGATVDDPRYVAALEDVPTNGTIRCEALRGRRGVEFILRREDGEAFAWRNSCPHEPEVRLDPGWGAMVRDGQIVCHEHGARFECGDGLCTYGPCRGKVLDPIGVDVRGGAVYLTDERFEACRRLR